MRELTREEIELHAWTKRCWNEPAWRQWIKDHPGHTAAEFDLFGGPAGPPKNSGGIGRVDDEKVHAGVFAPRTQPACAEAAREQTMSDDDEIIEKETK